LPPVWGEKLTLQNNISSIIFRLYEPATPDDQSHNFASAAIEIESALREDGHLVFYDTSRRAIWYFRLQEKDTSVDNVVQELESSFTSCGYTLTMADEGTIEPANLQKVRSIAPPTNSAPSSSSSTGVGPDHAQRNASMGQNYQVQDVKGTTSNGLDAKPPQMQQKIAYENFIAATLLAVSTAVCPVISATPLNYRTIFLPLTKENGDGGELPPESVLGTFGAYLTTLGALVITFKVTLCKGVMSLDNLLGTSLTTPGQKILTAPFGIQASHGFGGELGTSSLAQTPNTQTLSFRAATDVSDGLWKQACTRILRFRGIADSILDDCHWINVAIARRRFQDNRIDGKAPKDGGAVIISWPRPLCFRQRIVDMPLTSQVNDNVISGHEESHDPLGTAGRWLNTTNDRDEQVSRRKIDRAALAAVEPDGTSSRTQHAADHGSISLARPATATAGAMYPTPPDAIQQPNGITPTFDGTASSPRNPPSNPAGDAVDIDVADAEETVQNGPDIPNSDSEMWDRPESRRERSDSNILGETDNMLMGGDMFGENDITEADFNFFDEEPDEMDLAMADFSGSDNSPRKPPTAAKAEEPLPKMESSTTRLAFEDAHVFTKPELKHARSFMNDEQTGRLQTEKPLSLAKPTSSPFDSETVFRQVRASINASMDRSSSRQGSKRKASIFEKIDLGTTLPMMNKKYEKGGQFNFDQSRAEELKITSQKSVLPETDYLKRHGKRNRKNKEHNLPTNALKRFTALDHVIAQQSPFRTAGSPSDDDQSSESDQDDSSYTSEDMGSPTKSSIKHPMRDDENASQITSMRDIDATEEPDHQFATELPRLSKPEPPEIALSKLFLDPEPMTLEQSLADEDIVQIAQILTEQAATGSLVIFDSGKNKSSLFMVGTKRQELIMKARDSINALRSVMPKSLEHVLPSRLKGFLEIPDVPIVGQPNRLQSRPMPGRDQNAEQLRPSNLYPIPCHHLEVRRAESKLSVLPSAVTFWESLGLAPASGGKDVLSVCVFPGWDGMADNVKTFLDRAKSVYELLRLGTFETLALGEDHEAGLLPYELDRISTSPDASVTGHGSALIEAMEVLHNTFASTEALQHNFVIYMIYSPSSPGTIVEACLAFQRFFDTHWKKLAARRETAQNELVLQLVSVDLISSPSSVVVTQSSDLMKLCIETYDRCTLFDGIMPAPAVVLEQTPPRIIDFKLTSSPSASLIHENSCIHLAYAQSIDDRWVSAAWTDDRGSYQATASYCLGRKGRSLATPLHDVCLEIWQSTLEIVSVRKVHWRIIITKSGPMDPDELGFWAELARTEATANVSLVLMTVDTDPSLQLLPPVVQLPTTAPGFYTTPVSTPQPNIVSPEQSATPATPARDATTAAAGTPGAETTGDSEADAALLDLTDQTWAAVLGHRLNNGTSQLELQPSLVSGYLIKRTGSRVEDPPVVMEVNLVHTESAVRPYEHLLREMLSYFRALGTLARARGMVEREADVRPWHIAAAEKAVRALYMLL
jgi:mediator of RNA polymerase II transcription subunit 13